MPAFHACPTLLVVDFRYFYPESTRRAGNPATRRIDGTHRRPPSTDSFRLFWARFRTAPDAPLWITEHPLQAAHPRPGGMPWRHVWLFASRHHAGAPGSYDHWRATGHRLSDDAWTYHLFAAGADLHIRYPTGHTGPEAQPGIPVDRATDTGMPMRGRLFHGIIICRSRAYLPDSCAVGWRQLLTACPIPEPRRHDLTGDAGGDSTPCRHTATEGVQ